MYRSNPSRLFPAIILTLVVISLVIGLFTVARSMFASSTPKVEEDSSVITPSEQLTTVTSNRSVQMTIRGPLVANEEFRSYRVDISPNARTYSVYKGYLESVVKNQSFDNNTKAYEEFVYALDKAAFTKEGKLTEEEASDIRGICATGQVFEFELFDGDTRLQRYWTSTCKGSTGTLGASVSQLANLFTTQIPEKVDYDTRFGSRLLF